LIYLWLQKKPGGHALGKYPQTIRFVLREVYRIEKLLFRVCHAMLLTGSRATMESAS
jgi:hypothetical protein